MSSYALNRDIRPFETTADVEGYRIVCAANTTDNRIRTGAAGTDRNLGVAERVGGKAGTMLDVTTAGLTEVRVGGPLDFNDPVTADAQGRAVKAVPVANQMVFVVGFIRAESAAGDIAPIHVAPFVFAPLA